MKLNEAEAVCERFQSIREGMCPHKRTHSTFAGCVQAEVVEVSEALTFAITGRVLDGVGFRERL